MGDNRLLNIHSFFNLIFAAKTIGSGSHLVDLLLSTFFSLGLDARSVVKHTVDRKYKAWKRRIPQSALGRWLTYNESIVIGLSMTTTTAFSTHQMNVVPSPNARRRTMIKTDIWRVAASCLLTIAGVVVTCSIYLNALQAHAHIPSVYLQDINRPRCDHVKNEPDHVIQSGRNKKRKKVKDLLPCDRGTTRAWERCY